jgi:phenylalanyl-tRNA synthetase alpha chain
MTSNLNNIILEFQQEIASSNATKDIEIIKGKYLGKSSPFSEFYKKLGTLKDEEKKNLGQELNKCKEIVNNTIEAKYLELKNIEINKKLLLEKIDPTLNINKQTLGGIHPISKVQDEVISILSRYGFEIAKGPDVEICLNNFTHLNIDSNHPSRQMHDTFYIKDDCDYSSDQKLVLRTHTSSVQIRTLKDASMPVRFISGGRVFRSDDDATHSPMFHQMEALLIDEHTTIEHLKFILQEFIYEFFGNREIPIRLRPSFFPFTTPSIEIDIGYYVENKELIIGKGENNKWLEVLGAGMIHPNVMKNCGIDTEKYQGFAFGLGLDRFAMLKYKIADLRSFFEGDAKWLSYYNSLL